MCVLWQMPCTVSPCVLRAWLRACFELGSAVLCLLCWSGPVCLQAQAEQCLNDDELRLLGGLLQEHATVMCLPAADGAESEELRINYDGFNSVSAVQAPGVSPPSSGMLVCPPQKQWLTTRQLKAAALLRCCDCSCNNWWLAACCLLLCSTGRQEGFGASRHQHSRGYAFHAAGAVPAL